MIVLDANIAMDFWRYVYPKSRALDSPQPYIDDLEELRRGSSSLTFGLASVWHDVPSWLDRDFLDRSGQTLSLLVFDQRQRRRSGSHVTNAWSGRIPEGSFYDFGNGVLIPSPAFTFFRMASSLPLLELIAYGDELCGRYAFDVASERGMAMRETPLVTVEQLARFVESARGCHGYKQASRAISHLVDGSASPMEALDEMLFCLPYRLGGYGLEKPLMNHEIKLSRDASVIARRRTCFADMCWPEIMLIVEHNGFFDHGGERGFDSDRERINALIKEGFEVIELTRRQVNDPEAFEQVALHVAKRLGKRIRKEVCGLTDTRSELREAITRWNASYGEPGKLRRR